MAKLHYSWSQLSADYARLWNELSEDDALKKFHDLIYRERDLSELATTDAPNDQIRWDASKSKSGSSTGSKAHELHGR